MRAEVGVGVLLCPTVENLGERGGLATARGQVLLEHEYERDVAFGGEVHDVLGNDRPACPSGDRCHVRVFGGSKTDLGCDLTDAMRPVIKPRICKRQVSRAGPN